MRLHAVRYRRLGPYRQGRRRYAGLPDPARLMATRRSECPLAALGRKSCVHMGLEVHSISRKMTKSRWDDYFRRDANNYSFAKKALITGGLLAVFAAFMIVIGLSSGESVAATMTSRDFLSSMVIGLFISVGSWVLFTKRT